MACRCICLLVLLVLTMGVPRAVGEEVEVIGGYTGSVGADVQPGGNRSLVHERIRTGRKLAATGTALYFSGLGLQLISIPVLLAEVDNSPSSVPVAGITLLLVGGGLDVLGPIPSCIGGTISENAVNKLNPGYPSHAGWKRYGKSWLYVGIGTGVNLVGGMVGQDSPMVGLVFSLVGLGFSVAAEVNRGIAAVQPFIYSNKAELDHFAFLNDIRLIPAVHPVNREHGVRLSYGF